MVEFTRALERLGIPIFGVSFGRIDDRNSWRIDFKPEATSQQRTTAEALKLTYNPATDTDYRNEVELARFDGERFVKAVVVWTAQKLDIPLATARQEILAIYRNL
jgi:hypothetical protein